MVEVLSETKLSKTSVSVDTRIVEAEPGKSLDERYKTYKEHRP